jgi:hypothetical protein
MLCLLRLLFIFATKLFCSRPDLLSDNLALRQQFAVLNRRHSQPRFAFTVKWFWVMLRRLWPAWKWALILVQPATVTRWHRAGFELYRTWLLRHRSSVERECVRRELRELIFRMVT